MKREEKSLKTNKKGAAMSTRPNSEHWRSVSEEVLTGMAQWREEHPKATLSEIEEELDARLARLRAQMLQEVAQTSTATDWNEQEEQQRPRCPHCGSLLQARGKHKRMLQTQGGQQIELSRSYGTCPQCGSGLFPPR